MWSVNGFLVVTDSEWIFGSGYSFHMCHDANVFYDYSKMNAGQVLLRNNLSGDIVGSGNIKLQLHDGTIK